MSPKGNQQQSLRLWNKFNEQTLSDIESNISNSNNRNQTRAERPAIATTASTDNNKNENHVRTPVERSTRELNLVKTSNQKKLHQTTPIPEGSMGTQPRMGSK